jgi:hypothetical protein
MLLMLCVDAYTYILCGLWRSLIQNAKDNNSLIYVIIAQSVQKNVIIAQTIHTPVRHPPSSGTEAPSAARFPVQRAGGWVRCGAGIGFSGSIADRADTWVFFSRFCILCLRFTRFFSGSRWRTKIRGRNNPYFNIRQRFRLTLTFQES